MIKRVKIRKGNIALVFRDGSHTQTLTAGSYWLTWFDEVKVYNLAKPFQSPIALNLLLRDHILVANLSIVDVKDHEIALHYEDGHFKAVLPAGRHAFWKGVIDHTFLHIDLNQTAISEEIDVAILNRAELSPYLYTVQVSQHQKALLYMDSKFQKVLDTGIYRYWRGIHTWSIQLANMQKNQLEVNGQEILTKDKAALRINFMAQYQIVDIEKALKENHDYHKQLYTYIQLALRSYVGTMTLDELLDNKQSVGNQILEAVQEKSKQLGIQVTDCGLRDVILPGEVKEIMNQVLVAQKKAQANTITRREETASTRSLLNTAKLMEENEMLFKLKEMEYVEKIADKINSISLSGGTQVVDQLRAIFGS
ncbi:MAG: slipin family protein [Flammeovirgaceae bacterium]